MSNTRRAETGAQFRQEKFASSAQFERGLMGNLVAKRAELLAAPADRELIWFLQLLSHAPGGLEKFTADLMTQFPARVATKTMQACGFKPGQIYNAENVAKIREEIPHSPFSELFPLKGECFHEYQLREESDAEFFARKRELGRKHPSHYPASDFIKLCHEAAAESLPKLLLEICLDPQCNLATCAPWYFPALLETLREIKAAWIEQHRARQAVTELGRQVYDTLDFCLQGGCMVLIDGLARTGKTFSAKAWCDLHPGQARYVQVPSSNDDVGFFRAIAKSLGVSINQNSKAQQLRDRIEEVLQRSRLALVLDEAHYLWPQSNYREALPGRVNWIMTALVNHGVPVALVTTPQFMRTQNAIERKSCWTSEQFTGRIGHYQKLPDSLSTEDLTAVAKAFLPEGCARSIETLVVYAQGSAKYLAAIESGVRRARFLAEKEKRAKVIFADVKSAIKESVIPSDAALATALAEPHKARRGRTLPTPLNVATAPPERQQRPVEIEAPGLGADRIHKDLISA